MNVDRRKKPTTFQEVAGDEHYTVNGQHTLAACTELISEAVEERGKELIEFLSVWPVCVVYSESDTPLYFISSALNQDKKGQKHDVTFVDQIRHVRDLWISKGRPAKVARLSATGANHVDYNNWKVCHLVHFLCVFFQFVYVVEATGVHLWPPSMCKPICLANLCLANLFVYVRSFNVQELDL